MTCSRGVVLMSLDFGTDLLKMGVWGGEGTSLAGTEVGDGQARQSRGGLDTSLDRSERSPQGPG